MRLLVRVIIQLNITSTKSFSVYDNIMVPKAQLPLKHKADIAVDLNNGMKENELMEKYKDG